MWLTILFTWCLITSIQAIRTLIREVIEVSFEQEISKEEEQKTKFIQWFFYLVCCFSWGCFYYLNN